MNNEERQQEGLKRDQERHKNWYTNGEDAALLSKEIVREVRRRLNEVYK